MPSGTHVVQAVGQFDEDDADVLGHGEDHLAEVLCLRLRLALKLDLGEFGDPVHQRGHLLAEAFGEVLSGQVGVFDDVVEEGGHERLVVQTHLRQDAGHRQGVDDVGFAALAELPRMGPFGDLEGGADLPRLVLGEVVADQAAEVVDTQDRLGGGAGRFGFLCRHALGADLALGDLPQGDDGGFVVLPGHQGLAALLQLVGALGGQQHELKTIGDLLQAVLDGDTGHVNSYETKRNDTEKGARPRPARH